MSFWWQKIKVKLRLKYFPIEAFFVLCTSGAQEKHFLFAHLASPKLTPKTACQQKKIRCTAIYPYAWHAPLFMVVYMNRKTFVSFTLQMPWIQWILIHLFSCLQTLNAWMKANDIQVWGMMKSRCRMRITTIASIFYLQILWYKFVYYYFHFIIIAIFLC